jgi:hypothetical protein
MFVKFCEAHGKLTGSSLTGDRWELIMGALRELSGSSSQLRISSDSFLELVRPIFPRGNVGTEVRCVRTPTLDLEAREPLDP